MTTAPAASGEAEDYLTRCAETLTRSEIVAWLLRHYEKLEAATVRRTLRWDELAQRLNRAGLRNIHGQETNGGSLRVTWYRVRKFVAAERLQAEAEEADKESARLEAEARKVALREAARAEVARKSGEDAKLKERMAAAERAAQWAREREAARLTETVALAAQPIVKIGDVKRAPQMLVAAPRYGTDRDKPLPPPYVGARPAGMPDNLPLEALVSLDATGVDENGNLDFKNMPGLPRRSFFEKEYEWVECCMPMVKAVPPQDRSLALKFMFNWLKMFPGNR